MDRQNYTLYKEDMQLLRDIFFPIKDELAESLAGRKLIKRRRKLSDCNILVHACYLYIVDELSFYRLANVMLLYHNISMSPAAWRRQLQKCANDFFEIALEMLQKYANIPTSETIHFHAIDATDIAKEGGKGTEIRLHCDFSMDSSSLTQIIQTDCHGAETIANFTLSPDNCYVADRAYGKTTQILQVLKAPAYFLFRVSPSQIRLYADSECKNRLDFRKLMSEPLFETECYIKDGKRSLKIRLIGSEIPEEKREESKKRAKRKSAKNHKKISEATLQYAQWLFTVTNLPLEYREEDIIALYYGRWQIELMFKRAKTLLNFHKIRRSQHEYSKIVTKLWISIVSIICCIQMRFEQECESSYSIFAIFSTARHAFDPIFS